MIVFLKGKHIPLLVAAFMVSAVFLIPFTVLLLFATCLQKISSQRVSHWIVSLKPLIDVHHAPYKDTFRLWTGVLLLARVVLYLTFATNVQYDASFNLFSIIVVELTLVLSAGFINYKRWPEIVIESFFHVNLIIISAALLYIRSSNSIAYSEINSATTIIVSFGCGSGFLCFFAISTSHIYNKLKKYSCFHHAVQKVTKYRHRLTLTANTQERSNDYKAYDGNLNDQTFIPNEKSQFQMSIDSNQELREPFIEQQ